MRARTRVCLWVSAGGLHWPRARACAQRRCHLRAAAVCVCVCMCAHGFGFTTGMRRRGGSGCAMAVAAVVVVAMVLAAVVPHRRPTCSTGAAAHLCAGIALEGRTVLGSRLKSARQRSCRGPALSPWSVDRYHRSRVVHERVFYTHAWTVRCATSGHRCAAAAPYAPPVAVGRSSLKTALHSFCVFYFYHELWVNLFFEMCLCLK